MDIQSLQQGDIWQVKELQPKEWPDITPVIEFYVNTDFCFPFKAVSDNKILGIGTYILHNDVAWLAHIIVHAEHRNKGIGSLITQALIDQLREKNDLTIYLIATDLGEPVYKKLGFETETEYLVYTNIKTDANWQPSPNIIPATSNFIYQIADLDREVSGENRMFHLAQHLPHGYVYVKNHIVEGFYLPTFGEGLIIANVALAGIELMQLRINTKAFSIFPIENTPALTFMHTRGYKESKKVKRMRLGVERHWQPQHIYNRIGGNLG